jgi:hypothetical protein
MLSASTNDTTTEITITPKIANGSGKLNRKAYSTLENEKVH